MVHSKNSLPLIEEEGMAVQPNTATNLALDRVLFLQFGIKPFLEVYIKYKTLFWKSAPTLPLSLQISILRQPKPYGDCKSGWSETPYNDVVKTADFIQDIPYSQGVGKIDNCSWVLSI